jgi:hypothetical protein
MPNGGFRLRPTTQARPAPTGAAGLGTRTRRSRQQAGGRAVAGSNPVSPIEVQQGQGTASRCVEAPQNRLMQDFCWDLSTLALSVRHRALLVFRPRFRPRCPGGPGECFADHRLNAGPLDLKALRPPAVPVVSVALRCGLTPQYAALGGLHGAWNKCDASRRLIGFATHNGLGGYPSVRSSRCVAQHGANARF